MILSTLCYIEKDDKYLMLHRTKKKNDINKDKWLGIGGKFEEGESPEECIVREVREETGLKLNSYKLRTIVTYVSTNWETEYMYVFTSNDLLTLIPNQRLAFMDATSNCINLCGGILMILRFKES